MLKNSSLSPVEKSFDENTSQELSLQSLSKISGARQVFYTGLAEKEQIKADRRSRFGDKRSGGSSGVGSMSIDWGMKESRSYEVGSGLKFRFQVEVVRDM